MHLPALLVQLDFAEEQPSATVRRAMSTTVVLVHPAGVRPGSSRASQETQAEIQVKREEKYHESRSTVLYKRA
jgi:hypothetical protein